jgi:hypothetical protein
MVTEARRDTLIKRCFIQAEPLLGKAQSPTSVPLVVRVRPAIPKKLSLSTNKPLSLSMDGSAIPKPMAWLRVAVHFNKPQWLPRLVPCFPWAASQRTSRSAVVRLVIVNGEGVRTVRVPTKYQPFTGDIPIYNMGPKCSEME